MILIASKSAETLKTLSAALEWEGQEVETAESVSEALLCLEKCDILIIDVQTLGTCSIESVRDVWELFPLIALAGEGQVSEAFELGATDCIEKPFSPEFLIRRIRPLFPGWETA
jgi:DNA-binding response OmpR family regulator